MTVMEEACCTTKKSMKLTCHKGKPSVLTEVEEKLLPWINAMRASGVVVTTRLAARRAVKYKPSLRRMKRYTLFAVVRRFLVSHNAAQRAPTHVSQEDPRLKHQVATSYMLTTRALLTQTHRNKAFIINMDQTPYNPRDVPSKTWDQRGAKTVTAKQMKVGVGHVSVLLTVCADGTKLPPLIVFKAKAGGRVEAEFTKPDFPKDGIYCAVQDNAWCDERIMLMWVDKVLKPYIATCPHGVIPYLLLDKYKCHSTAAVAHEIEQLGVEWDILPGGCTGLIQPIDVGIGKPFKNRLRSKWEDWMVENFDIDDSTGEIAETERIKPNSCRKLVA